MGRYLCVAAILNAFIFQSGCSQKAKVRLPVTQVKGKLTVAGKPVKQVELRFHPKTPLVDPLGKILCRVPPRMKMAHLPRTPMTAGMACRPAITRSLLSIPPCELIRAKQ